MPADADLQRHWRDNFRALDFAQALQASEVDALYQRRPDAPSEQIADTLRVRDPAGRFLLCGARGSGKSTELARLARELAREYCVVHVDVGSALPNPPSTLAVVTLLGAAVQRANTVWSAPDADLDLVHSSRTAFESAVEAAWGGAELASRLIELVGPVVKVFVPDTAPVIESARVVLKAGARLARELSGHGEPGVDAESAGEVVDAVNASLRALEELSGRAPLLLVDGLDKLTELREIKVALAEVELLEDLESAMVLTGPIPLRHDPRFRGAPGRLELLPLPNVGVRSLASDIDAQASEDGLKLLEELVHRRDVAKDLFPDEVIKRAALMSSGIVREFLKLLSDAGMEAYKDGRREVVVGDIEAAIRRLRLTLQSYLKSADFEVLTRVLAKPHVLPTTDRTDVLLYENLIACYANGNAWYRPHEVLVKIIQDVSGEGDREDGRLEG